MRIWLPLAIAALAASPAFAQDADAWADEPLPPVETDDGDIWNDDPYAEQDEMVLAVDSLMGALLDMPVGDLAGMLGDEAGRDVRPGDTVRDLGLRDDPNFEENIRGGARALTGVVGNMMRRISVIVPELEAMGATLGDSLAE